MIKQKVRAIWGHDIIMSPGKSNARGSLILVNNNFEYKRLKTEIDLNGNLIIAEIKIYNKYTLSLINLYGPNNDQPIF